VTTAVVNPHGGMGASVSLGILPIRQSSFLEVVFPADFDVTGSGEKRNSCGQWFWMGCLETHLHAVTKLPKGCGGQVGLDDSVQPFGVITKRLMHRCMRQVCPVCHKAWAIRETMRAAKRLRAFKLKGRILKPIHVVVSIPHVDYGLGICGMRFKVYKALKNVTFLGGMCIFHSKRWKNGVPYFSPHFHILGYGWLTDVRRNYIASGYVVRNLRIRKSVEGTIWYQLSHAAASQNKHTVTWFGCLSYNKLRVSKPPKKEHCCPLCMGKLRQLLWIGDGNCSVLEKEGFMCYGDSQGWVYADVLRRAGGGGKYG